MHKKSLKYKLFFSAFYLLFFHLVGFGQDPFYINYDMPDGLPSSEVYDVEVDQDGLVWFATDRGVCSYDGYQFKTYTFQDGLADNTNFEIFKDSKNRLWYTGFNGSLSIYEDGHFQEFRDNDTLQNILNGNWISQIIELQDGTFYGIHYFSDQASFIHFSDQGFIALVKRDSLPAGIDFPPDLDFLRLEEKGIVFNKKTFPFRKYKSRPFGRECFKHKGGWVYLDDKKLYKCDEAGQIMAFYPINKVVENIYLDRKNNLWFATENGVHFLQEGDFNRPSIQYFPNYYITSCVEDQEGNFWFTTIANGVLFIPSFDIHFIRPSNASSKRILSVNALKEHLYFGCASPTILAIDRSSRIKEHRLSGAGLTPGSQIISLGEKEDTLFVPHHKLFEVDGRTKIRKNDSDIYSSYYFLKNTQYLVYDGNKLFVKNQDNTKFAYLQGQKNRVTTIRQDEQEIIWIGTLDGLFKIEDYDYNSWEEVLLDQDMTFGRVSNIQIDALNRRWISTLGNGLFYHTDQEAFQIKKADGLNSDLVNCFLTLNDSTLLIGTNKGINVFNFYYSNEGSRIENIRSFTREDGLSSNKINTMYFWDNKIWLGTDNGICYFDPSLINQKAKRVPTKIDQFMVNDSTYSTKAHLELNHDENDIFIAYTGVSFRKNQVRKFYRYRLKSQGETPEWFYTNEKNIRYNNLSPGQYTFEVSAQNRSKEWSAQSATLSFDIHPHFMDTYWFKILLSLILLSLLGSIIFFQARRFRAKELAKRQLQEAEARIREVEHNALRNQMNPHFVFNALNSIQNFIFKKDIEKANYYLAKFSTLMRNSLHYTRLETITLQQELGFLKNYLELEAMRFREKFEFKFQVDPIIDVEDIMVPPLLLQPVLENAVKHGFKDIDYKGLLEILIKQEDEERLIIVIRDNGLGVSQKNIQAPLTNTKHQSLGLEIIQDRIKLLNEANQQVNSTFAYENLKNEVKETIGFQVTFLLAIQNKPFPT